MSGAKGRSGRKRIRSRTIQEYLDDLKDNELIDILDGLVNKASLSIKAKCPECKKTFEIPGGGDKDCAFYITNRIMGSPRQSIDQRSLSATIAFTPDDYALIGQLSAREKTFLEDYTPKLQIEVNNATKQEEKQGTDETIQVAQGNNATGGDETCAT